ncbi:MAG: hypothetical protein J5I91_08120 [Bacteroidetes bacterium]|nr:hypothetical protein [Bacteroidota bacterium]
MKRYFLTYLLIISVVLQSTSQIWIIASFYIQREYIAKTLCENRLNKDSDCDGKCYLNHELKENEKQQEQQFPDLKVREIQLFSDNFNFLSLFELQNDSDSQTLSIPDCIGICTEIKFSVFHPPRIS